jgi:hypothetical protein
MSKGILLFLLDYKRQFRVLFGRSHRQKPKIKLYAVGFCLWSRYPLQVLAADLFGLLRTVIGFSAAVGFTLLSLTQKGKP